MTDELIKDRVKVEWVELGEGWWGDYDPDDPMDEELLRFDVSWLDDAGQWVATAVEYGVSATGQTENEALARVMDALALHFKQTARPGRGP